MRDLNIWENRKIWAAILLVVFVFFYKPPIVEAIGKLFRSTFYAVKDFQSFQLNLKTPYAGEYVLPSAIQEMLAFIRTHQLDSYQISGQDTKKESTLRYNEIIPSAWPSRINPQSNNKFIFISELENASNCVVKERGREMALVFCH